MNLNIILLADNAHDFWAGFWSVWREIWGWLWSFESGRTCAIIILCLLFVAFLVWLMYKVEILPP